MKLVITVKMVDENGKTHAASESIINDFDVQQSSTVREVAMEYVKVAAFNMRLLLRKIDLG